MIVSKDIKSYKDYSKENERFDKFIKAIFMICDLSGFELKSRITVVDKRTGRVWR